MAEADVEEVEALHAEFEWLLQEEVNIVLEQLQGIILVLSAKIVFFMLGQVASATSSRHFLTNRPSVNGLDDLAISSEITKIALTVSLLALAAFLKRYCCFPNAAFTILQPCRFLDCLYLSSQVQDAGNNLLQALSLLTPPPLKTRFEFRSAEEVTQLMTTIMGCLQRGRASLIIPKKRTIEEILGSRNMKSLQPPLPSDIAASFYVQSHKLIFAVYHIHKDSHGQPKFDVFHAEASVPWLSEVLVLFTIALQLCQQLKDKVRMNCCLRLS
ncbi:unnamed protein product [Ixodes hexagonus]